MKTQTILITALALAVFVFSACSFSTANISSLNFGKNDTAKPTATSFNVGEKVFAVAAVSNASGKHKVKFNLKYENVAGKTRGDSLAKPEIEVDGDSDAFFNFTPNLPGDYSVDAALVDEQGREISKKSGIVKITGSAPAATETKTDAEHSSEDKDDN